MSKFLCAKEVANILGKSLKWLYQNQLHIPGRFTVNKSIFWDEEIFFSSLKERARKTKGR